MTRVIYTNREIIITGFVVLACFVLAYLFPTEENYQNTLSLIAFMILVPLLYIKLILKRDLKDFGIQVGDWKRGLIWGGISLVISLLLIYILLNYTEFLKTQGFVREFKNDFGSFLKYEFFTIGILVVMSEFFFRGFLMGSTIPRWGKWSMVIQAVLFFIFLALTGGLGIELAHFMISAFFSGWIFYQSRSILYPIAFSWIFIVVADAIVIRLI